MALEIIKGTRETAESKCVELLQMSIRKVLKKKEFCVIGLPGGRSIKGIFELMVQTPFDWSRLVFFFVDERCVPLDSDESNFKLFYETVVEPLAFEQQVEVNVMPYTNEEGLALYNEAFQELGNQFDIVLLGSGEDGHIASLFPNHELLDSTQEGFLEIIDSPKPPKRRITASKKIIENAKNAFVLFFGESKRKALDDFLSDEKNYTDCPAKIALHCEETIVLSD